MSISDSFAVLCNVLGGLRDQVHELTSVHNAIEEFNQVFGKFQNAMALHASCLEYPKPIEISPIPILPSLRPSGIPKPQAIGITTLNRNHTDNKTLIPTTKSKSKVSTAKPTGKRNGKIKTTKIVTPKKPDTAPWKWDKNLRDNIPRKYQSRAELDKLENILMYLKNRQHPITIADLVKHSHLPVIRCKEILQMLTKLELITRRQESSTFVYSFNRS